MQEAPGKHFPEYKFCVRLTSDSFTSPTRLGLERLRIYTQMGRRSIVDRFQWTTPVTFSRKTKAGLGLPGPRVSAGNSNSRYHTTPVVIVFA